MTLTNITGIGLPFAVWLASDSYDFTPGSEKAISVTSLLKSNRQILLRERLTEETAQTPDVSDFIASRSGHAYHDSLEQAWKRPQEALRQLGYPDQMINRILVNPTEQDIQRARAEGWEPHPIYLEQRFSKIYRGYRISGKFDMILEGMVRDFKSTSTFSYTKGAKDDDYIMQGSLYRWISPHLVTADMMEINFIFTDWMKARAKADLSYPQQRLLSYPLDLMSLEETQAWVDAKIDALEAAADLPEEQLPFCTDEELWKSPTTYKFYLDPQKAYTPGSRSTKNFDDLIEARAYQASKGGKGVIIDIPGQVKACSYCPAFPICTQKDLYDHG